MNGLADISACVHLSSYPSLADWRASIGASSEAASALDEVWYEIDPSMRRHTTDATMLPRLAARLIETGNAAERAALVAVALDILGLRTVAHFALQHRDARDRRAPRHNAACGRLPNAPFA